MLEAEAGDVIEIEYGDDEKELIGNNIMLMQLGADCISLMEP